MTDCQCEAPSTDVESPEDESDESSSDESDNNVDNVDIVDIVVSFIHKITEHVTSELNTKKNISKLKACKWQEGEANLDTDFSNLVKEIADEFISKNRIDDLRIITSISDLKLQIFYKDTEINDHQIPKKIELKSGKKKDKKIPGSCIKNIDLNQPLIYCYHGENGHVETKCSLYHQAMLSSDTDLFQDRTPRPLIKFDKMGKNIDIEYKKKEDWISHYAKCAFNRSVKKNWTKSWQDHLVKKIIYEFIRNIPIEEFISKKEEILEKDEKFKLIVCELEPEPELDI